MCMPWLPLSVRDNGIERPSMGDVLWNLEFALQLQETAEETGAVVIESSNDDGSTPFLLGKRDLEDPSTDSSAGITTTPTTTMSIGGRSIASQDPDGLTPSAVFSQINNPKGR